MRHDKSQGRKPWSVVICLKGDISPDIFSQQNTIKKSYAWLVVYAYVAPSSLIKPTEKKILGAAIKWLVFNIRAYRSLQKISHWSLEKCIISCLNVHIVLKIVDFVEQKKICISSRFNVVHIWIEPHKTIPPLRKGVQGIDEDELRQS